MNDKSGISANNSCFYYVTLELKINSSKLYHHYKTKNAVKSANCDCKHSLITLVTHLGTCPISFAVLHISSSSSLVNKTKCTNSLANLQQYNYSTAKLLSPSNALSYCLSLLCWAVKLFVKWGEYRALRYTVVNVQKVGGELRKSTRQQQSPGLMPIYLLKRVDGIEKELKYAHRCLVSPGEEMCSIKTMVGRWHLPSIYMSGRLLFKLNF